MFRCPPGEGARSEHETTQAGAIGVDRGGFTAKHLFAEYAAHFGVLGSKDINARRHIMFRALSIIAAVAALAVSTAAAWAGTPETAKGACHVPGFMDYTDDSCMAKAGRAGASAPPRHLEAARVARS